jgi:hypothetical protein
MIVFAFLLPRAESAYGGWQEQAKLLASDGHYGDRFGMAVSISGDYAIIGAQFNDDKGESCGSVYIFKNDGASWSQQQKLIASDGTAFDLFGYVVSISGDYAIGGAPYDDDNGTDSGSAYIIKRDGTNWSEQAKLVASDGADEDHFGISVSISGDKTIVGASDDNDNGMLIGSAYIFNRDGTSWSQQQKLTAADIDVDGHFGISVSISGDYAIVGAYGDDDNGTKSGSAYIFKRNGTSWSEQAKLIASDGSAEDNFGISVSISGDYAIVGAFLDDDNGRDSGSAYIFKRDGTSWSEQAKLVASDGAADDYFGRSVSISGDYAIVGAYADDDNGSWSGSAYIFKRDGTSWSEQAKLVASDGAADDYFGYPVSISGNRAIIGAGNKDDNGESSGSAYIFDKVLCPPPDLTDDCFVDFEDLRVLSSQWLLEELSSDVWPEGGDGNVNFFDWAVFAASWQITTDFDDLADFADQWLHSGANYYIADIAPAGGDDIVNMLDFAALAENWLAGVD